MSGTGCLIHRKVRNLSCTNSTFMWYSFKKASFNPCLLNTVYRQHFHNHRWFIQFSNFAGSRYEVTCMELTFKLYMSALVKSGLHMAEWSWYRPTVLGITAVVKAKCVQQCGFGGYCFIFVVCLCCTAV